MPLLKIKLNCNIMSTFVFTINNLWCLGPIKKWQFVTSNKNLKKSMYFFFCYALKMQNKSKSKLVLSRSKRFPNQTKPQSQPILVTFPLGKSLLSHFAGAQGTKAKIAPIYTLYGTVWLQNGALVGKRFACICFFPGWKSVEQVNWFPRKKKDAR